MMHELYVTHNYLAKERYSPSSGSLATTTKLFLKRLAIMLILVFGSKLNAQVKYFLLDSVSNAYDYSHHVLNAAELYGVEKQVEIFNFLYNASGRENLNTAPDQNLVLFSVLPDTESSENWKEIHLDSIKHHLISFPYLKTLLEAHTMMRFDKKYGEQTKFFNTYALVLKKNDKYYVSKFCLLQFYAIRNRPKIFNNVYGTINIDLTPITVKEVAAVYEKTYPSSTFPMLSPETNVYFTNFDRLRDRREYLSKIFNLKDTTAYQFWTYTDWHEHTFNYEVDRGIDRFVYVPGRGIVGGSFDFYFYFHRKKLGIPSAVFQDNVLNERIMLTTE